MDLRQFKFASGEEVICEVINWNDEEHETIVVRRAMKIVSVEDMDEGLRYYTFKPWASMNNDPDLMQVVNPYHIVADNHPAEQAKTTYYEVIEEMRKFGAEEEDALEFYTRDIKDSDASNVFDITKRLH